MRQDSAEFPSRAQYIREFVTPSDYPGKYGETACRVAFLRCDLRQLSSVPYCPTGSELGRLPFP